MEAIVAVYSDWGIGANGTQPLVIKADRKHFRNVTGNHTIIYGRKTLEDFPNGKILPNRRNIIITRQDIEVEGAEIAHSPEEAVALCGDDERAFIIGGASIYSAMLKYMDKIHLTCIDAKPLSDVFFENLDVSDDFECIERSEEYHEDETSFCFATYTRR